MGRVGRWHAKAKMQQSKWIYSCHENLGMETAPQPCADRSQCDVVAYYVERRSYCPLAFNVAHDHLAQCNFFREESAGSREMKEEIEGRKKEHQLMGVQGCKVDLLSPHAVIDPYLSMDACLWLAW